MPREVQIRGRTVVIHDEGDPHHATLSIDGTDIPLTYHEGFEGWGVMHTIYGFFPELERLANHMIVSNPTLEIGHGVVTAEVMTMIREAQASPTVLTGKRTRHGC